MEYWSTAHSLDHVQRGGIQSIRQACVSHNGLEIAKTTVFPEQPWR
jgi:hypothetical protein